MNKKKSTPKVKKKTPTEKRHPLGMKLTTIQKQIEESPKFLNAVEFLEGFYSYVKNNFSTETNVKETLNELIKSYVDEIGMFVTEKDRIAELVRIKLNYDVKSIREFKGRFMIQVVQDGKTDTIFVKKDTKGDGYIYGHGNFKIGKFSNSKDEE